MVKRYLRLLVPSWPPAAMYPAARAPYLTNPIQLMLRRKRMEVRFSPMTLYLMLLIIHVPSQSTQPFDWRLRVMNKIPGKTKVTRNFLLGRSFTINAKNHQKLLHLQLRSSVSQKRINDVLEYILRIL